MATRRRYSSPMPAEGMLSNQLYHFEPLAVEAFCWRSVFLRILRQLPVRTIRAVPPPRWLSAVWNQEA